MARIPRIVSTQPKLLMEQHAMAMDKPLQNTAIAKNAKSEEVKRKRIECFRFINSAVPFYLPLKQHKMVPTELDYKDREYWGNAIHFLLSNKAHGFPIWKQFQEQVRSMDASDTCRPHISAEKTNLILKHLQETAANQIINNSLEHFLTDQFVLVQLPFQPVLLFLWLSAAMYWISMLGSHLCLFSNFPFPEKFKHQLIRLQEVFEEMQVNIGFLFDYLQHQVESENEIFVGNLELFEKVLKKALDGIKIFYTREAVMFLRYVAKNSIIGSWPDEPLCRLKKTAMPLTKRNYIFNLDFWKALPSKDLKMFGSSEEKIVRKASVKKLTSFQVLSILEKNFKSDRITLDKLNHFKKKHLMLDREFLGIVSKLNQIGNGYTSLLCESGDQGSVADILVANVCSEYKIAKLEVTCWLVNNSLLPAKVLLNLLPLHFPGNDIEDLIPTISEIEKKPLTLRTIMRDFLYNFRRRNISGLINNNKPKTVNLFEMKIREIILSCILTNLEIKYFEKEKDEKLRDWQVAQFLLPCFVASYNNICRLQPSIDENVKLWYGKFIHNLITAYEGEDGIRKSSWTNIKKDIDANSDLEDDAKLLDFIKTVVDSFNNKIKQFPSQIGAFIKFCPIWDTLYEVLRKKHGGSSQNEDISSEPSMYWNWLMWDFFSKMKHAISISG